MTMYRNGEMSQNKNRYPPTHDKKQMIAAFKPSVQRRSVEKRKRGSAADDLLLGSFMEKQAVI